MERLEAEKIVGGLSVPSKMPGYAWSIPAKECNVGSTLRKVEGSSCHSCYAFKGRYSWPSTVAAMERRFKNLANPRWVEAMIVLLSTQRVRQHEYFRWFDSGDIQNAEHLDKIVAVARGTPFLHHWLPTREYAVVREYASGNKIPKNLVIRLSAPMIDGPVPDWWKNTSSVHHYAGPKGRSCPAKSQGNVCADCRSCWDSRVKNISYPRH